MGACRRTVCVNLHNIIITKIWLRINGDTTICQNRNLPDRTCRPRKWTLRLSYMENKRLDYRGWMGWYSTRPGHRNHDFWPSQRVSKHFVPSLLTLLLHYSVNYENPDCSFYLSVSMSRNTSVPCDLYKNMFGVDQRWVLCGWCIKSDGCR